MMMSFHLPPIAASAAVSGQLLTGFGRRVGGVVTRRFLLVATAPVHYDAKMTLILFTLAVGLQPFRELAPRAAAAAARPAQSAAANVRDGQHDFDFEFGTWKARVSRLDRPLTGSSTWLEYVGTSVVRKVWDGRANLGELEVEGAAGHIEGMTIRLYNRDSHQWNITWANA